LIIFIILCIIHSIYAIIDYQYIYIYIYIYDYINIIITEVFVGRSTLAAKHASVPLGITVQSLKLAFSKVAEMRTIIIIIILNFIYTYDRCFSLQSPFGCSSFADLLSAPYTDPADAGSLPEELDPFPELQLGNPQGVPSVDESAQSQQSVHHQQPPQPPPPPPPLPEDIQADSLRYVVNSQSLSAL